MNHSMSESMGSRTTQVSKLSLWDLPEDVVEQILPEIEYHRDLVNFACTSRLSSELVIPRHTEYRVLRLGTLTNAHVWAHLARRPDLACNIRDVDIENVAASHLLEPFALIEAVDREERTWEVQKEEIVRVLGNMPRLRAFSWDYFLGALEGHEQIEHHFAPIVFDVMQRASSVEHLRLKICEPFGFNEPVVECGLWKITNLRSFVIDGYWPSEADLNPTIFVNWLNNLTSLEFLKLPGEMFERHNDGLFFPHLRSLQLDTSHDDLNHIVLRFLERHSSVEELSWRSYLPDLLSFPTNFLPKLRSLHCQYDLFLSLMAHTEREASPRRKIESLSIGPDWHVTNIDDFCAVQGIDHNALRQLSLDCQEDSSDVQKLAEAFPMIEELALSNLISGATLHFETLLLGLEQLTSLRALYRDVIWTDLGITKGEVDIETSHIRAIDERVQALAERCPSLIQIGHPHIWHSWLIIERDDGKVSTRTADSPPRSKFKTYNTVFCSLV